MFSTDLTLEGSIFQRLGAPIRSPNTSIEFKDKVNQRLRISQIWRPSHSPC